MVYSVAMTNTAKQEVGAIAKELRSAIDGVTTALATFELRTDPDWGDVGALRESLGHVCEAAQALVGLGGDAEPEPFDLMPVADHLRALGHQAMFETTGGGVVCLFIGEPIPFGDGDAVYPLTIGPASYDDGSYWGWPGECSVGPDLAGTFPGSDAYGLPTTTADAIAMADRMFSEGKIHTPESVKAATTR